MFETKEISNTALNANFDLFLFFCFRNKAIISINNVTTVMARRFRRDLAPIDMQSLGSEVKFRLDT